MPQFSIWVLPQSWTVPACVLFVSLWFYGIFAFFENSKWTKTSDLVPFPCRNLLYSFFWLSIQMYMPTRIKGIFLIFHLSLSIFFVGLIRPILLCIFFSPNDATTNKGKPRPPQTGSIIIRKQVYGFFICFRNKTKKMNKNNDRKRAHPALNYAIMRVKIWISSEREERRYEWVAVFCFFFSIQLFLLFKAEMKLNWIDWRQWSDLSGCN